MTAPARLLAVRLQGFKSFAERTTVEFGPGISAVVGPNGSGKSNLADALRWALGEQGRSLRVRKAEDVIWAGSDRRSAQGMADVAIVLDNADGLLPVEFGVVELGRRLYRSGENDYLLNRQRVRLRDLVDLLDAGNLADNAFLFIGQGMVDQALSLRPEERRPLFEEVAGVARHERRRKRSEAQLKESLANLARVEDILAELRPQARRLAAQAAQQTSRLSVGEELVDALLASGHSRWHDAASRQASADAAFRRARAEADDAMGELVAAEDTVTAITAQLDARAEHERALRAALETLTTARTGAELRRERLTAEAQAMARDQSRLAEERRAVEAALVTDRAALARPLPDRDVDLEAALSEAERELTEATAEVAALRAADRARDLEQAAIRRAVAARAAEAETAGRRLVEAEKRLSAERAKSDDAARRLQDLERTASEARSALEAAAAAEAAAIERRDGARDDHDAAEAVVSAAREMAETRSAAAANSRARLQALRASLSSGESDALARVARSVGGRRLDESLSVEPDLRTAVGAALADVVRAWVVSRPAISSLRPARGTLVVDDQAAARETDAALPQDATAADREFLQLVAAKGGGSLATAIRRDPLGTTTRLLARAAWLPDLPTCVDLQPSLPPGWILVPRDGSAVVGAMTVALGAPDGVLDKQAEVESLAGEVERLEAAARTATAELDRAITAVTAAREALAAARAHEASTAAERRRQEEAERRTGRDLDAAVRDADWHRVQVARLELEAGRLRGALPTPGTADLEVAAGEAGDGPTATGDGPTGDGPTGHPALTAWEARVADIRARRDRIAEQVSVAEVARRELEAQRTRAEASLALRVERVSAIDVQLDGLAERAGSNDVAVAAVGHELGEAAAREAAARAEVEQTVAASAADRDRLAAAERAAAASRDRVRRVEEAARSTERAALEAQLGLAALRDQLIADLGGLGELAVGRLPAPDGEPADDRAPVETVIDEITRGWAATSPPLDPPGPGRIAALRRRYLELGAANPFAVEEHETLQARLQTLEAQRADLLVAVERTRRLIDELGALIADQFQSTFRALESAFDRRFRQLFGGGSARLELTDPSDVETTGIEITARPPGKKRQPLAMLSGGERSLTGVALLLAMLEVRPVPFCVLDEVDAALDEANVGRFTAALRDLAAATQFVVITHNRATIHAADALYGVTVGDDSVSRVISLRLDGVETARDEPVARAGVAVPMEPGIAASMDSGVAVPVERG